MQRFRKVFDDQPEWFEIKHCVVGTFHFSVLKPKQIEIKQPRAERSFDSFVTIVRKHLRTTCLFYLSVGWQVFFSDGPGFVGVS
jgi:hypothetical protein